MITRLEEETTSSKEEVERAAEARIRRVREKYEAELREVERSERNTQEKFSNLKVSLHGIWSLGDIMMLWDVDSTLFTFTSWIMLLCVHSSVPSYLD